MVLGSSKFPQLPKVCPFCGVATDLPHETQEGCIEALRVEIARMRNVLDHSRPIGSPTKSPGGSDESGL